MVDTLWSMVLFIGSVHGVMLTALSSLLPSFHHVNSPAVITHAGPCISINDRTCRDSKTAAWRPDRRCAPDFAHTVGIDASLCMSNLHF